MNQPIFLAVIHWYYNYSCCNAMVSIISPAIESMNHVSQDINQVVYGIQLKFQLTL